jgi:3-polyprenyl-4-hydroxybenzoate decarboxylase
VLWAIATRSDPAASFEIQTECPSSPLDPMLSPEMRARGDMTTSRAVIIACRPWLWRDAFPVVNRVGDALRQDALAKWRTLFE